MLDAKITVFGLISHASLPVQAILTVLLLLSIFSWMFIIKRNQSITRARKKLEEFEHTFWSGADLIKMYESLSKRKQQLAGVQSIFYIGFKEFIRLNKDGIAPAAIMEGVSRSMNTTLNKEHSKLEKHLSFLATVGSVSPYIGLFGTVWGIMMAFQALSNVHQASLAMVAPGISEALVATAMGLFAAIPAVVAYNRSANRLNGLMNNYEVFMDEFLTVLHRKVYQPKNK